jgi:VIT1/CCC1 family predicted Fe2+/Mn2+ transporter
LGPLEALVYLLVSIWVAAVPLAMIGYISRRLVRADPPIWKHIGLVVAALLAAGIWPIFGLFSVCTVGVGCDL